MTRWLAILCAFLFAGCAHMHEASVAQQRAECEARAGVLTAFPDLYPGRELSDADKGRYVCNLPTADGGKPCTNRFGQCQGACLAPPGAPIGQAATGTCAARMLVPDGTRFIVDGVVAEPVLE
jgi:hypothetical protein